MQVINYLGRYTNRVAITNNRIVRFENGQVTFRWKDYRDKAVATKLMTLDAFEFVRRFLLHILPHGFFKIRYYGIFSSRNHRTTLAQCKVILRVKVTQEDSTTNIWIEFMYELTGIDVSICPLCGQGRMVTIELVMPRAQSPP